MITRSRSRSQTIFTFDIDFDDASNAWKANKVPKGNGTYTYACEAIKLDGCKCSQPVHENTNYCRRHVKK